MHFKEWILANPYSLDLKSSLLEDSIESGVAQTQYTAISVGTEIAAYRGCSPLRKTSNPYPRKIGYCNLARVIKEDVTLGVSEGDFVLTTESHKSLFVLNNETFLYKVENKQPSPFLALSYQYFLGQEALLSLSSDNVEKLAIIGGGVLAQCAAQLAQVSGHKVTIISDYLDPGDCQNFNIRSRSNIDEINDFDAVLLYTNSWKDYRIAVDLIKEHRVLSIIGFPGRGGVLPEFNPLDSSFFYDKQLTIKAVGKEWRSMPPDIIEARFARIETLINSNRLRPTDLVFDVASHLDLENLYHQISEHNSNKTAIMDWSF